MSRLKASKKDIDPALANLFASSSGPVKAPPSSRYSALPPPRSQKPAQTQDAESAEEAEEEVDDEELSELDEDELNADEDESDEDEESEEADSEPEDAVVSDGDSGKIEEAPAPSKKDRKRKRKDEFDDLESKYLRKLADDDDAPEHTDKRLKPESKEDAKGEGEEAQDGSDSDSEPLVHETLLGKSEEDADIEVDKANRTLFLGNVSVEAVTSTKAKKTLLAHLASPLADVDAASGPHKIESLRFRSTPFSGGALPKRAAFITKAVMSATTSSTNAYVVYSTSTAARAALKALNGTVVLDRHLRADSVAHPAPVNHRRCVFVGNLGFVDDETVLSNKGDGETVAKKRTKVPADVEEGLWRTFGQHAGPVESVRVPRDPKTRVGKGFAYVQFRDANDVEAALLLDGKKFPPMLPRALRVSRAKDPRKTALAAERSSKARLGDGAAAGGPNGGAAGKPKSTKYKHKATPEQQSLAGRASRLFGKAGAARQARELKGRGGDRPRQRGPRGAGGNEAGGDIGAGLKTPEQIVFEGRRASAKDGKPKDLKFNKGQGKKGAGRPKGRGARRAAEWRKGGK